LSKAFTRESDQDLPEDPPEPADLLPPGVRNYVTPEGAVRLREELRELVQEIRPGVAAARTAGDSEARTRLRFIDRRIATLRDRVASMEVVDPERQDEDRVRFGATVTVSDEAGEDRVYRIVGVDEADPAAGKVSWLSPIARALLGKEEGERVPLELPGGRACLAILDIRYR